MIQHIDATDQILGRLATRIAHLLRGKHKATYQPHRDEGDTIVVSFASRLKVTGKKREAKVYHSYSGYPGGLKTKTFAHIVEKDAGEVLRRAVFQMLPPTRLRARMMKRLIIEKE